MSEKKERISYWYPTGFFLIVVFFFLLMSLVKINRPYNRELWDEILNGNFPYWVLLATYVLMMVIIFIHNLRARKD